MGNSCCGTPRTSTEESFEALERSSAADAARTELIRAQLDSVIEDAQEEPAKENPLGVGRSHHRRHRHPPPGSLQSSGTTDCPIDIDSENFRRESGSGEERSPSLGTDRGSLHSPHSAGASTVAFMDVSSPTSSASRKSSQSRTPSFNVSAPFVMPS